MAGRIVSLRLRPMALAERGLVAPTVRLADLVSGQRPQIGGDSPLRLVDDVEQIVASGLPASKIAARWGVRRSSPAPSTE